MLFPLLIKATPQPKSAQIPLTKNPCDNFMQGFYFLCNYHKGEGKFGASILMGNMNAGLDVVFS